MDLLEGKMPGTSSPTSVSTRLQKIVKLAREAPGMVITTLAHHIDIELLTEAYRLTRKNGAVGIDGQNATEYAKDLKANLESLLERFKTGSYKAPPVKRVYIPKGDGKRTRPIGIPTFEDKVLQRAVSMVLEAVYEQDFLDCSYGFRPGRSAHAALDDLWQTLMSIRGGYVLEVDIRKYFDNLDHRHLRAFLDQRVRDGMIRKAIDKWLKAGVLEDGNIHHPEGGTPQGGVISPLLANVYLNEALDKWFEAKVKPRLTGPALLFRYCDDFIIVLSSQYDAKRVWDVLPKRLGRFGLALHPDKTRLLPFKPPTPGYRSKRRPGTFDLLGFTHYWGKSRKGNWVVKRKTAKDRFRRALKGMNLWCRRNRHLPLDLQRQILAWKLNGHYQYYGVTGNWRALACFLFEVRKVWRKWLGRRSQKARMNWDRYARLLRRYPLPTPKITHSYLKGVANT